MNLAKYTSSELIVPHLRGNDQASVIEELSELLEKNHQISDARRFSQAALEGENLAGNNTQASLVFPHVRVTGISQPTMAIGRSDAALPWGGHASPSVRVVFLLAVPEEDMSQCAQLVSGLSVLLTEPSLKEKLVDAGNAADTLQVLNEVGLRPVSSQ